MMLATSAATPATMMTAFAKRSPVPRGSVSEASCCKWLPVDMVVVAAKEPRAAGVQVRRWEVRYAATAQ